jgi:hypothetical protein
LAWFVLSISIWKGGAVQKQKDDIVGDWPENKSGASGRRSPITGCGIKE